MVTIDRWLPPQLTGVEDRWQALQARVFVVLLLLFLLPVFPAALILGSVTLLGVMDLKILAIVSTIAGSGVVACYAYFYRSANLVVSSGIYGVLALLMVTTVVFQTGGWTSPVAVFLLTLPVLVSLVMNLRSGILYSILVLAVYLFLYVLHHIEYPFPQVVNEKHLPVAASALWMLSLVSIFASLLLYDASEKTLSASLLNDRAQLERYAHHDPLTGLFNEQALFERLDEWKARHSDFHLAYISIDNVAPIRNHFGFELADEFVVEVTRKLHQELVPGAMLARYSAADFVICLEDASHQRQAEFSGMAYRIQRWNRCPIMLASGFRFLLDVQVGLSNSLEYPELDGRALIDQARGSKSHGL